jgi:hypothetical protein
MKDLKGQKFGKLTALEPVGKNKKRCVLWRCICECGNESVVASDALSSGRIKSCGCLRLENLRRAFKENGGHCQHGMHGTRLYSSWRGMLNRCQNTSDPEKFQTYGGRGISVCQEWHEFEPFRKWALQNGYAAELTLDRIDVNGDYCPENCRWATPKQQARNRRDNVTYQGRCLAEWAEEVGIGYQTLRKRIEAGWTWERALSTPVRR